MSGMENKGVPKVESADDIAAQIAREEAAKGASKIEKELQAKAEIAKGKSRFGGFMNSIKNGYQKVKESLAETFHTKEIANFASNVGSHITAIPEYLAAEAADFNETRVEVVQAIGKGLANAKDKMNETATLAKDKAAEIKRDIGGVVERSSATVEVAIADIGLAATTAKVGFLKRLFSGHWKMKTELSHLTENVANKDAQMEAIMAQNQQLLDLLAKVPQSALKKAAKNANLAA
jgi:predicted transcriptional regulator